MKDTQNLTLASKCFCDAVTHDLLTVENNIDFALRSWDQQCFRTIHSNKSVIFESWCLYICSSIGSRFIEKLFWKTGFCSLYLYLTLESLSPFKPVWTFQNQTTGFYLAQPEITATTTSSLSFSATSVAWVEKFSEEKRIMLVPRSTRSRRRADIFLFFLLTRAIDFAEKEGLFIIYNSAYRD